MDIAAILPWAIFIAISIGLWAVFNLFNSSESRASERLEELRDPRRRAREEQERGRQGRGVGAMIEKAAPTISKAIGPKTELEQSELKVRLANAGFNSPVAPHMFLALKVFLLIIGAIAGAVGGLATWGMTQKGLTALVLGGGFGFYLPEIGLWFIRKGRQERIFLGLPDALDLLVVCVEAGLGLDAGMRRVSEELVDAHPDVCKEFALCNLQLQMGRPRREVLHDLGVRTGVDDMKALSAILIQADKFGSSIAHALRVQSDSMRVKRRQMAEERAQQTAVKMIFPLVLFIFPGIFVVLVGPAAIMMINGLFAK